MSRRRGRQLQNQAGQESAGISVRVSLDRSAKGLQEEIVSPETQEDRARAYCQAQGWRVAAVERDIDESAYRQHYTQREGLMRLLAAVERGELTKIVVWKFSRLSRRLKEFLEICDRVEAAGGGVVSVSEQVDTSTPAGRLIRNILASFAQFQSEELSEQIFETWMTIAKRGLRPAGMVNFGAVNKRGVLEPDPETHPHLVAMYRTFRDTGSLKAVWDYLAAHEVPAPKAAEWNLNTIRGILSNPIYIGRMDWAGQEFEGRWEPLVPVELWEEVQQLLAARRTLPTRRRDARMLTGLIRCGQCGRPMWTRYGKRIADGRTRLARLYWCCNPHNQRKGCWVPAVLGEEVDAAAWRVVLSVVSGPQLQELVRSSSAQRSTPGQDEQSQRRRQLMTRKAQIEERINALFDRIADIPRAQFRQQNQRYLEQLSAIQAELAAIPDALPGPSPESILAAARRAREAQTEEERREVLVALGVEVTVTDRRVWLEVMGNRFNLRGRRLGETWHFGEVYQRLDYQGPLFTDKQLEFLRRTYAWADKRQIATRLGRDYMSIIARARALGLSPKGRGKWARKKSSSASD